MADAAMSMVYVLTTPIPEDGGDDPTVEQVRKRNKWDNDDYVCRGLILKGCIKFTQHKMNMDEAIQVSCIIDKLSPSWKDLKHTLNHKKEELTLVELGSHLRIEESLREQDSNKPKGNNVVSPQLNIVNNIGKLAFMSTFKLNDFKIIAKKLWGERGIGMHLCSDMHEHSKDFRFYVIEPNESVSINSIIESRDAIFDENRFSSVPRPSLRIPNGTEDIGGSVVPEEVVTQQPEPELRKGKKNRTPKDFGPDIYSIFKLKRSMDEVFDLTPISFKFEVNPKTFAEALQSSTQGCKPLGFATWNLQKKTKWRVSATIRLLIAMTSINNLIIHQMDVKTSFLNGDLDEEQAPKQMHQKFDEVVLSNGIYLTKLANVYIANFVNLDLNIEVWNSNFSVYLMRKVLKKFNYFDCTQPDIAFAVGKLSRYTSNPGTQHWQAIQRVLKYLKKTMDYKLTYTGYPSVLEGLQKIKLAYHGSTWNLNFVALAAAGKETEWLKNLILEIPLWSKPITPISIRCDSAATLAKAYSQMYNGKSRHLGLNKNLADHLTKGLARDLVIKSAEGMGLKSN
ncbi:zinc finger, CCHC-type containing protein [Tanacetum coccineum]